MSAFSRDWSTRSAVPFLLIGCLGAALYANTLHNALLWDDQQAILDNQFVHDWRNAPKYFTENWIAGAGVVDSYWRPMTLLVFALGWQLWGASPLGYHVINPSVHIADAMLLFALLAALFGRRGLALLTALVFLAHPVQTEVVAYVNGLSDPLSVFFMLLGLALYLRYRDARAPWWKRSLYAGVVLLYALALMSKESSVVLPALVCLVDFFYEKGRSSEVLGRRLAAALARTWPLFAVAVVYVLLRATALNFENSLNLTGEQNQFTSSIVVRLFTFFQVLVTYARLLVWPFDLHMEHTVDFSTSFFSAPVVLGAGIATALLAAAVGCLRVRPLVSFGILWFFIGIAPTSNIAVPINGLLYEHWLYLPLIGIYFAGFSVAVPLADRYGLESAGRVVFAVILVFFCIRTVQQNAIWRSPIELYRYTMKYSPQSYRLTNNLALAYRDAGRFDEAREMFQRAIAIDPKVAAAYHNLGSLYGASGDYDRAEENFVAALRADPDFLFAVNALLLMRIERKQYAAAEELVLQRLERKGPRVEFFVVLAKLANAQNKRDAALDWLRRAAALAPGDEAIASALAAAERETR